MTNVMSQPSDRRTATSAADSAGREIDDPGVSSEVVIEPGALLEGKYLVAAQLGAGGMGTVYLAHDRVLERDVAIKVTSPHIRADAAPELMVSAVRRALGMPSQAP